MNQTWVCQGCKKEFTYTPQAVATLARIPPERCPECAGSDWYLSGCPPTKGDHDPIMQVTLHRRQKLRELTQLSQDVEGGYR